jgi:hypothetical protein
MVPKSSKKNDVLASFKKVLDNFEDYEHCYISEILDYLERRNLKNIVFKKGATKSKVEKILNLCPIFNKV